MGTGRLVSYSHLLELTIGIEYAPRTQTWTATSYYPSIRAMGKSADEALDLLVKSILDHDYRQIDKIDQSKEQYHTRIEKIKQMLNE